MEATTEKADASESAAAQADVPSNAASNKDSKQMESQIKDGKAPPLRKWKVPTWYHKKTETSQVLK